MPAGISLSSRVPDANNQILNDFLLQPAKERLSRLRQRVASPTAIASAIKRKLPLSTVVVSLPFQIELTAKLDKGAAETPYQSSRVRNAFALSHGYSDDAMLILDVRHACRRARDQKCFISMPCFLSA